MPSRRTFCKFPFPLWFSAATNVSVFLPSLWDLDFCVASALFGSLAVSLRFLSVLTATICRHSSFAGTIKFLWCVLKCYGILFDSAIGSYIADHQVTSNSLEGQEVAQAHCINYMYTP